MADLPPFYFYCTFDFATEEDMGSIAQEAAVDTGLAAKKDALELGSGVLEDEVGVAARLQAEIRDLATDPKRGEPLFELSLDLRGEVGDGEDLARGGGREKLAEVPL